MQTSILKFSAILGLVFIFFGDSCSSVAASDGIHYYFGIKGVYHYPAGDFDGKEPGELTIEDDDSSYSFIYLPYELVDNYGVGVTFGGYNDFAAGEISYSQSKHGLIWNGVEQVDINDAILDMLNLDLKFFPPNSGAKKIKPYGQLGFVVSTLSIKDGATDLVEIDKAFYSGYGYNLGFGLMINIGKKLILDGSVCYQKITFNELKTLGIKADVPEDLYLTTRTYNLGIKYCFK